MSSKPARLDEMVSVYVNDLRRRYPGFRHEHTEELKQMSHDGLLRFFSEHLVSGERAGYDSFLQGMLSPEERDRLHRDEKFTQAWRIFVDLCWTKKQVTRAALIVGAIALLMIGVVAVIWSIPQVARGPVPPR